MSGMLLGAAALILFVATVVMSARWRRDEPTTSAAGRRLLRSARRRMLVAVSAAATVVVTAFAVAQAIPEWLGLPLGVAPLAGAAIGLLLYCAAPPSAVPLDPRGPRVASLQRRTPWSAIPRGWAMALLAAVAVQIGLLVFTGVTATTDDQGRARAIGFELGPVASISSPYAGWFYGIPLIVATVVLAGATLAALARVSTTPALPDPDDAVTDEGWRRATTRIIAAIGISAVLFQTGGVAYFSGTAIRIAHFEGVPGAWAVAGQAMPIAGAILVVAALVLAGLVVAWVLQLPSLAVAPRARRDPRGAVLEVSR